MQTRYLPIGRTINIKRSTEKEAQTAVAELEKRDYKIVYPITKKIEGDGNSTYVAKCEKIR